MDKIELEKDNLSHEDPFSISAVTLSFGDTFEINYYVKKEDVKQYNNIYIIVENEKRFDSSSSLKIEIKDYKEKDGYYIFTNTDTFFQELTNNQVVTLIGDSNQKIKKTSITYNVANYIENVTYHESTSEKTKNLLITLANFGASVQNYFKYETDNLITKYIDVNDINTSNTITNEANELLENLEQLDNTVPNSSDITEYSEYILDHAYGINNTIFKSSMAVFDETPSEEQINNSGIIYFSKESYNRMMKDGINYDLMNINSKYIIKNSNIKFSNEKFNVEIYDKILSFSLNLSMNNLDEKFYYRMYYKKDDIYKYGKVGVTSILHICKNSIEQSTNERAISLNTNLLNLVALLKRC